jgi:hypothetical protein
MDVGVTGSCELVVFYPSCIEEFIMNTYLVSYPPPTANDADGDHG